MSRLDDFYTVAAIENRVEAGLAPENLEAGYLNDPWEVREDFRRLITRVRKLEAALELIAKSDVVASNMGAIVNARKALTYG